MKTKNSYLKYSSVGISLAAGFLVFAYGGYWLDERYFQNSWLLYLGLFMGLAYGGYEIWKLIIKINNDQ